ncbi:MAG TPA: hypothetical protein VJA44_03345 [Acidimicrobiia bacterium]|nr:hypothetical protein [Acidimicrobiia bacterium]
MAMSAEHKAALAAGRRESRAIKLYLDALASRRPGRPITPETLTKRIKDLEKRIAAEVNPLKAVDLRQARLDAENTLETAKGSADSASLETDFTRFAKAYSKRKGISYTAWREAGVPAALLKKAGINRAG